MNQLPGRLGRGNSPRDAVRVALACLALVAGAPAFAATGGPDAYGYTWRDSNEPGVPFTWEEISSSGSSISGPGGDDFNFGFQPLSFPFRYYGTWYSRIAACSNGWASLVDDTSASFTNTALPAPGAPAGTLAAFWDDLSVVTGEGKVLYRDFGDRAVIEWINVERLADLGVLNTFEIIIRSSGVIQVSYLQVNASRTSCTIGIESPDDTGGLTAWRDDPVGPPASGYTVEFLPPAPIPTTLDCSVAPVITCPQVVSGDLAAGQARQSAYGCLPGALDGREQVYRLDLAEPTTIGFTLEMLSGSAELILLDGCDVNTCATVPGGTAARLLHAGTWYAVVDCPAGAEGTFRLHLDCLSMTFCGNALLETRPSANPDYPSWWMDDGSWLVRGWLYHPFDADDNALRVDGGTIYDDRGSPGCVPFPAVSHGLLSPSGPGFVDWSAPAGSLHLGLAPVTVGGCCGLGVDIRVTNTDTVPHGYEYRVYYDTAFGNAAYIPPGCVFDDAIDGGPTEVRGVRYLDEQDLKALGADTCEGQVRMFTAEDPSWLRSSWEMLPPNVPEIMELMGWHDGDAPGVRWSGFINGEMIGDCVGDNSLLFVWRFPPGGGTLAPGESSDAHYRIGWGCSFPCAGCELPVLGASVIEVSSCNDGIRLSWDAATFPGAGNGVYHVYRSTVSWDDALAQPPVASGLAVTAWADSGAVSGTDYFYVIQAESLDFPGCGSGPQVSGSTAELRVGPVRANPDVTPPAGVIGPALRATGHGVDTVDFNWLLAPPPGTGEHCVVLRSDDRPQGPFVQVAALAGQSWTDPSAPARFFPTHCWYYLVHLADDCGNLSIEP